MLDTRWMTFNQLAQSVTSIFPDETFVQTFDRMIAICSVATNGDGPVSGSGLFFHGGAVTIYEQSDMSDDSPLVPWIVTIMDNEETSYSFLPTDAQRGGPIYENSEDEFQASTLSFLSMTWWLPLNTQALLSM